MLFKYKLIRKIEKMQEEIFNKLPQKKSKEMMRKILTEKVTKEEAKCIYNHILFCQTEILEKLKQNYKQP